MVIKYVSVSEMQAIEREANAGGLTYETMMANAGRGLADVILENYAYLAEAGALGLVGSGNNGGDTLVALKHLADEGWKSSALILRPRPAGDPLVAELLEAGGGVHDVSARPDEDLVDRLLAVHGLLMDGVLGTGFQLPLRDDLAQVLDFIRRWVEAAETPPVVVAVDCPSGVDCNSGQAAPQTLKADHTVTMAAVKHGLLKFPAYALVGDLDVVEIGLPRGGEDLDSWRSVQTIVPDQAWVQGVLPRRPLEAHKGTFGTALVVAGSANYTGAALLAGQAAYRVGAGLVTLAVPEVLHAPLAGQFPEATWVLLPQEKGAIAAGAAPMVLESLERVTSLLVGCGFGLAQTSAGFLSALLEARALPAMVLDADGLKLVKSIPDWQSRLPAQTVLTPHPGEMSVLTDLSIPEIQASRLEIAQDYSRRWGHVVVLKGAFTVIASPEGACGIIPVATPALARAGTGDVLAGLIAGLRAQGLNAFQAAVAGAWLHASAGMKAAAALGTPASVLAGDVLKEIPQALAELN